MFNGRGLKGQAGYSGRGLKGRAGCRQTEVQTNKQKDDLWVLRQRIGEQTGRQTDSFAIAWTNMALLGNVRQKSERRPTCDFRLT